MLLQYCRGNEKNRRRRRRRERVDRQQKRASVRGVAGDRQGGRAGWLIHADIRPGRCGARPGWVGLGIGRRETAGHDEGPCVCLLTLQQ